MSFTRTLLVTRWPREVDPAWLQQILSHRGLVDIALYVTPIEEDTASAKLEDLIATYGSTVALERANIGIAGSLADAIHAAERVIRGAERLHSVGLYLTVRGATKEELETETKAVIRRCRKLTLKVEPALFRQRDGLATTLPLGVDRLNHRRHFTSEAVGCVFPFATGSFAGHPDTGILMGQVMATGGPAFVDRFRLPNHNTTVLASSGAGKSFGVKVQIGWEVERGVQVEILDPEGEYEALTRTLGGAVVQPGEPVPEDARLVCYSLAEVDEEQLGAAAGDVLAQVWKRVRRERTRRKLLVVDEGFLLLVENPTANRVVWAIAKRSRKYNCGLVLISQDLGDVLSTPLGLAIIANSSIKILLRQGTEGVMEDLARVFKLSQGECDFLTAAAQGQALLIAGDERTRVRIKATPFELSYCRSDPAARQGSESDDAPPSGESASFAMQPYAHA